MVNPTELFPEISEVDLRSFITGGMNYHPFHNDTRSRAEIMEMFYNAVDVSEPNPDVLKRVVKQSAIESDDDYTKRIERMPIIPFEKMFVRAKERIFQGHGVRRDFSGDNEAVWKELMKNFDDQSESIDNFFRKKVFHYKEVLGFAGIVVDLVTKLEEDGEGDYVRTTYQDEKGEPVPYTYLVRPSEIYDYDMVQGHYRYLIIRQEADNELDWYYTIYTPRKVYKYGQKIDTIDGERSTTEIKEFESEHPFGRVPFVALKGEQDMDSGFQVGRPQRYSLLPLYKMAIEIAYDLQEVSLLYGHPIPVMAEEQVKQLLGAVGNDGKYNPEAISAQLGAVVQVPENQEFPDQLFFQPDTSGLQHLKDYLFDLIETVHKFASIRDKTQVVSNVSGIAKALDTVEERGVLASASREMESYEHQTLSIMASARSDINFESDWVQYQKEFDMSTASEHMKTLVEGSAQNALTFEMYKYHAIESLRKSGAPQAKIDDIESKLDEVGRPIRTSVQEILSVVQEGNDALTEGMSKHVKILEHFLENNTQESEEDESSDDVNDDNSAFNNDE